MKTLATSPAFDWASLSALRRAALSPRGLVLIGILTIGAAGALNWGWLVALGAAPFILGALPCAAMCALGLCMKGTGGSCDSEWAAIRPHDTESPN